MWVGAAPRAVHQDVLPFLNEAPSIRPGVLVGDNPAYAKGGTKVRRSDPVSFDLQRGLKALDLNKGDDKVTREEGYKDRGAQGIGTGSG